MIFSFAATSIVAVMAPVFIAPAEQPEQQLSRSPSSGARQGTGRSKLADQVAAIQAKRASLATGDKSAQFELIRPSTKQVATTEEQLPPPPDPVGTFRTLSESTPTHDSQSDRLEARLTGLQRQVEQLAQVHSSNQPSDVDRALQMLQQIQSTAQIQNLERQIQQLQALPHERPPEPAAIRNPPVEAAPDPLPPTPAPVLKAEPGAPGSERFSLQIQDTDIRRVLETLAQLSGESILVSKSVSGTVSANLQDVTIEQALTAVLRSHGYIHERSEAFIYVSTPEEAATRNKLDLKVITKVYRPHYISVKDLESLVSPLLTVGIGKIAITAPTEVGIGSNAESAGGDTLSQGDALLVQDYPEVIEALDGIIAEIDVPPMQVVIEAMILSVKLTDSMAFGVNFAILGGSNKELVVSGNGQTLNNTTGFPGDGNDSLLPPAGQFLANTAGLKLGFLQGDVATFVNALESISDTNLIAAPQLRVLNKQRAELIIGDRISYKTLAFNGTQTVENVQFLDSGTKLFIRPFIAPDGLVRMEIHPERSSAVIDPNTGLPNQATTEVTTNVMTRDSSTVVIGGLIEEQVVEGFERVPLLGALPVVGRVFRNKTESISRNELIVLITPRVVREPTAVAEGEAARVENEVRHESFRNNLSHINRRNLARVHYERALMLFERGEFEKAHHHIQEALRNSKNDVNALRLREQIEQHYQPMERRWWSPWPPPESKPDAEAKEPGLPLLPEALTSRPLPKKSSVRTR